MNELDDFRFWLKPALAIIVGAILLSSSSDLTPYIAWCIGITVALTGLGRLVWFFSHKSKNFWQLLGAAALLVMGLFVILEPDRPEIRASLVAGILLLYQAIREVMYAIAPLNRILALVTGCVGVALLLMPRFAPLYVAFAGGIAVLVAGIGMVLKQLHSIGKSDKKPKLPRKNRNREPRLRDPGDAKLIDSQRE